MNTATEDSSPGLSPTVPMPRIRAEALASLPVDETRSDGASWFSARTSFAPEFLSASALTALTAIGTFDSAVERRVAVMTMSRLSPDPASTAATASAGALATTAPLAAVAGAGVAAGGEVGF